MTADIVIRAPSPADQAVLLELQRRASLANPGDRALLLTHPDIITLPAKQLTAETACIAELGGHVAGFAIVLRREDGDAELDGLFVDPDLWRQGVGRALVGQAVVLGRAMGARRLYVIGNLHAEGFYRAAGFTELEKVTLQFGEGLLMQRAL